MLEIIRINLTTNAGGAATVTDDRKIYGKLLAVQLVDGTFDDGVDITLTCVTPDFDIPLLTKADWNTDQIVYPRVLEALNTDGTALTTHEKPLIAGQIKAVIAQGGNVKAGAVICFVECY